ncbi:hypothetical protein AOLI_G00039070 [Acnodon oligacanthus]
MQVSLYLLLVLHVAEGCTLVKSSEILPITAHTGGDGTSPAASSPSAMDSKFFIYAAVGGSLLLMVLSGIIYWRYRAQRRGQMESCERKPDLRRDQETRTDCEVLYATVNKEDKRNKVQETVDVTYSTVVHSNTSAPANKLMDTEDTAECASIKLN